MDTENKSATPEQKPQDQAAASPTPPPASPSAVPSDPKVDAKPDSASKSAAMPPSSAEATPKKSSSMLWILILVAAIVCGAGGFFLGQGTSQASDTGKKQDSPTPTVAQGQKEVTTKITGKVKTDTHGLSYLLVDISEFGAVKATNHQTRYILDPQANAEYTYSFENLKQNVPFVVTMQGCVDKDQRATCVLSKKVVACSGRIPGGAVQQCLITGDGEADFFLDKSLVSDLVSPVATPTLAPEVPTATPMP